MSRVRWILLLLVLLVVAWQTVRTAFPEHERSVRTQVKATVESIFPEYAEQARARFGLVRLQTPRPGRHDVVLVHGLDDPGLVWMNLAPALQAAGYGVSILNYPNDQPIHDSARLFARELQADFGHSTGAISIVAHSMGGLVAREMLTNPALACTVPDCKRPPVSQLIMVGTPNHGSYLARFRGLSELREQISRLIDGEAGWLDGIFDGAGEAGLDLIPDSPFLVELNGRPAPAGTEMHVIAGVIGKEEAEALALLLEGTQTAPGEAVLMPLVEYIGDGLVSVGSARLQGVPLTRVSGNHLSIIRNLSESSQRVPPALPVIFALLDK